MIKKKLFRYSYAVLLLAFILSSFSFSYGKTNNNIVILKQKIDSIVGTINCTVSIQIVSASKYDLLYSYKPEIKMIPASITKVITSSTALMNLGAGYEFKTVIYTDDNYIDDGIINGNLYIKGYGDPDLSTYDVINLADQVAQKNIKEITGNIIYDNSYLDDEYKGLANYYQGDTKATYWPYVCALSIDKNKGSTNPAYVAAKILSDELTNKNIKLDGIIISGITPESSKEVSKFSRTLSDVIINMNKVSDNQSAITLFKVIGANYKSAPGTLRKGTDAVINFLTTIGVDRSNYEILEGSGLTRYNYVTSDLYIQLLKYIYDQEKSFNCFYASLPVAGVDGTLSDRMKNTEAEKNVHAKTGTINSVSSLTGYAVSRDNELMIFYIAMNGFGNSPNPIRKKQDSICELICQFSRK
jgi:D-alanyl-D-alanine carboxypeptidase/D-alanyl-D-alanine-endopeptidase (penicillin-binding protein 4)